MRFRVMAIHIPTYWECIKYAAVNADRVEKGYVQEYLNELLWNLLSDKSQCFMRLSDQKQLQAVIITQIRTNKLTDKKYLYIQCMFSFTGRDKDVWEKDFDFLKEFANKENCDYFLFDSDNKRIHKLALSLGFSSVSETMSYSLGGN